MATLSLVYELFALIFISTIIHQSTAPQIGDIFSKSKAMFKVFQEVTRSGTDYAAAYENDLKANKATYISNFSKLGELVTSTATQYDQLFQTAGYYSNNLQDRAKIRKAISETFFAMFGGNMNDCPGYAKLNEILGKVSN